ncbi:MAG: hypothetical protein ACNFW9_03600 [Candidatus Kerfeldbacteria bacterium]
MHEKSNSTTDELFQQVLDKINAVLKEWDPRKAGSRKVVVSFKQKHANDKLGNLLDESDKTRIVKHYKKLGFKKVKWTTESYKYQGQVEKNGTTWCDFHLTVPKS